ncbi:hypothetical protein KKHFBJBL_02214 [Brevundimonas sp. NIBR11]|nr:hypothetical protein KKHFBJBL_02214 [Brevundimonas sp. NIBR11]
MKHGAHDLGRVVVRPDNRRHVAGQPHSELLKPSDAIRNEKGFATSLEAIQDTGRAACLRLLNRYGLSICSRGKCHNDKRRKGG